MRLRDGRLLPVVGPTYALTDAAAAFDPTRRSHGKPIIRVTEDRREQRMVTVPQTPAATAALAVASRFYSPALLNHCVRSYLWGATYASAHGIAFDDELYYVSALLHDIALTDPSIVTACPSRRRVANLAWVFGAAAGWPADRAARAMEIIVLHMREDVSSTADPESHLLQVATSWDVVGKRPEEFPTEVRTEILSHYPREGFGAEFLARFQDQARRKPDSAAAASVAHNAAERIAANPSTACTDGEVRQRQVVPGSGWTSRSRPRRRVGTTRRSEVHHVRSRRVDRPRALYTVRSKSCCPRPQRSSPSLSSRVR